MLRIVKKWSIKPLIYICFAIALGLTVIVEAKVHPAPSRDTQSPRLTRWLRYRENAGTSSGWHGTWAL